MLEITEVAPTGTNRAEFVVSPSLAATWVDQTCDTRHAYRAARVWIAEDGQAWVWAHRITKSGADYASGMGINMVLRAGSSPIGAGWNAVTGDLAVELLNRGWHRSFSPDDAEQPFPSFRWSRQPAAAPEEPKTARGELMVHPAVTLIDAPRDGLSRVEARLVDGGTLPEFVGLLRGGEFLTGDPEGEGYMGVPAEYVGRYLDGVLNARTMPEDAWARSNILLAIMFDGKDPMFQSAAPEVDEWADELGPIEEAVACTPGAGCNNDRTCVAHGGKVEPIPADHPWNASFHEDPTTYFIGDTPMVSAASEQASRIAGLEEQVVGYQQSLGQANERIAELEEQLEVSDGHRAAGMARIAEFEARARGEWGPKHGAMMLQALRSVEVPKAAAHSITADQTQEADRLISVAGVPVGLQAGDVENADQAGLLIEHRRNHPHWPACIEVTAWFGGQMVSLALDADTAVEVRRQV